MKVIDLIRLIRKHFMILMITPLALSVAVIYLTRKPSFTFSSETTIYTGIASGGGIEMDKSFSYFANNTAFDNLINIIKSRETQQDVAIRLLAQHLMLDHYDPKYISKKSFIALKKSTPAYIYKLVVKNGHSQTIMPSQEVEPEVEAEVHQTDTTVLHASYHEVNPGETLYSLASRYGITVEELKEFNDLRGNQLEVGQVLRVSKRHGDQAENDSTTVVEPEEEVSPLLARDTFSVSSLTADNGWIQLPPHINKADYDQTVKNLIEYATTSDTNFIFKLLNFSHPHYSIKAISKITPLRIGSSDLVKVKYQADDPGICQQTLYFLTDACIRNYKLLKENRSDAVVKYFEYQVKQALGRLSMAEDKLLKFNEDNKIINYYEQSKAVAQVKENIEVDYYDQRIRLAGADAAIKRIEEKMGLQQQIQLNSAGIIEKRNDLSRVNERIAAIESVSIKDPINSQELSKLKKRAETLKEDIQRIVGNLYGLNNSPNGLPIASLLADWIKNVLIYEETKAGLLVLSERITEFQKQYSIYAPAGANLKRIEREINVSEQEFLELLHGLNLAKLKDQDAQLSSNLKAVDPPYFPLTPDPTKRKILIILAGMLGFIFVFAIILITEYFDNTLKNPKKAEKAINLKYAGMFPKIYLKTRKINFPFVTNRLLELIIQQVTLSKLESNRPETPHTILLYSPLSNEGKSVLARNLAFKLKKQGKKVLVLSFSRESLRENEMQQLEYPGITPEKSRSGYVKTKSRFSILGFLLGYPDTRVDYDSPFLKPATDLLDSEEYYDYAVNQEYYSVESYQDILRYNHIHLSFQPDFVIIEIPPIIYYPYPVGLVASVHTPLMVCRANRSWSHADREALENIMKFTSIEPRFLLNGVEFEVIETVMGDLPRKRSRLRRFLKNMVRFQLFSRYQP
ncbi:MAG: LysM peptidoglycan-binding domain-containing protein [Bacteroidales bacterium]|nr:LysM peptidoglycan-binding domain-containing protein [Bacteroidales bacterium]